MRATIPFRILTFLALLAGALIPALAPGTPPAAVYAQSDPGCVIPTGPERIVNGYFQGPNGTPLPAPWEVTGSGVDTRNTLDGSFARFDYEVPSLQTIRQTIDVSGLAGQTVRLSFQQLGASGSASIGSTSIDFPTVITRTISRTATYQIPADGSVQSVTIAISRGEARYLYIQSVSVRVLGPCPVNTPPAFTSQTAAITLAATSAAGATLPASTSLPTATDADSTAPGNATTVSCVVPIGGSSATVTPGQTVFPLGTTRVTCMAADVRPQDSAAVAPVTTGFAVTVTDQAAPVFGVLPNVTGAATGPDGAVVTYPLPSASDAVDSSVTVSCAPASGTTFRIGETTVNCTAPDDASNVGRGSFTVTVTDQAAPVFTALPNVTVGATSNYGTVVTYALPTATDDTTTPTVTCVPPPGSQFAIGTTRVDCTATDGVNPTTGSFTVTVTSNGFRDPRDPRPGASPQTQPPTTPTPRPARPPRG
jgi:hypothetical protein